MAAVEEHVFTPEAVEKVIRLTERDEAQEHRERLEVERADMASLDNMSRTPRQAAEPGFLTQ